MGPWGYILSFYFFYFVFRCRYLDLVIFSFSGSRHSMPWLLFFPFCRFQSSFLLRTRISFSFSGVIFKTTMTWKILKRSFNYCWWLMRKRPINKTSATTSLIKHGLIIYVSLENISFRNKHWQLCCSFDQVNIWLMTVTSYFDLLNLFFKLSKMNM